MRAAVGPHKQPRSSSFGGTGDRGLNVRPAVGGEAHSRAVTDNKPEPRPPGKADRGSRTEGVSQMEDQTQVNIPLLRKAVEWAEAEAARPVAERLWEQGSYILPTLDEVAEDDREWVAFTRKRLTKAADCGTCFCIAGKVAFDATGNMDYEQADVIAMAELGISSEQADVLFGGGNTIEDVRRIAEDIAGERL